MLHFSGANALLSDLFCMGGSGGELRELKFEKPAASVLTKRELEVARYYSDGWTYQEIAEKLGRSPSTVRNHIVSIFRKLRVSSKVQLYKHLHAGDIAPVTASSAERADTEGRTKRGLTQIAVSDFVDVVGGPDHEKLGQLIAQDVRAGLLKFLGIEVLSKEATMGAQDELTRYHLVEGTIQSLRKGLRFRARLVDAHSGNLIWSESYDLPKKAAAEEQDHVVHRIVAGVYQGYRGIEMARARAKEEHELNLEELSMKALSLIYEAANYGDPVPLDRAAKILDDILAQDPDVELALWCCALVHFYKATFHWEDFRDQAKAARTYIDRIGRSHEFKACTLMLVAWLDLYDNRFDEAIAVHRFAGELNPAMAANFFAMSWTEAVSGEFEAAREHAQHALALSPLELRIWTAEGFSATALAALMERNYDEAIKWSHLAHQRQPVTQLIQFTTFSEIGETGAAKRHLQALGEIAPNFLIGIKDGTVKTCRDDNHNKRFQDALADVSLEFLKTS